MKRSVVSVSYLVTVCEGFFVFFFFLLVVLIHSVSTVTQLIHIPQWKCREHVSFLSEIDNLDGTRNNVAKNMHI